MSQACLKMTEIQLEKNRKDFTITGLTLFRDLAISLNHHVVQFTGSRQCIDPNMIRRIIKNQKPQVKE